ncbi:MAG: hypothetical protein PHY23_06425 [Oscillospiraceae bacterium]|nr:hypothetical protein [Oscillospiraceae bacterium]
MLKKIYSELVLIRKELQAIRHSEELGVTTLIDGEVTASSVIPYLTIHDTDGANPKP